MFKSPVYVDDAVQLYNIQSVINIIKGNIFSHITGIKYVPRTRKYIASERRQVTAASFKSGTSVVKRPLRTGIREIIRKPAPYTKQDLRTERPAKKKPPRKLNTGNLEGSTSKSTTEASARKVEAKKLEAPSVEPALDGHYELSPMLSKMVDAELQAVMKKVWELEPTNPQDAAQKVVVNKFRNEAGEAFRNTLGLNITKRLLNIHNPLYVKMVFSGKPMRAELIAFLKKYNISAFKRVGERGGTFAAKMRTFQDFDDLCTNKNLKCGTIRVTVTPCYQFTTCPPNLRTHYFGKEASRNNNAASSKPQAAVPQEAVKPEKNTEQQNIGQQKVTPKITPTKPNQSANVKATPLKTQDKQTESAKITPKVTPAKVENKPASKAADTVPAENKTQNAAPKVTPVKPPVAKNQNSTPKQAQVQAKPSPATNTTTKVEASKTDQGQKATPAKVTTPQNTAPKAQQESQNKTVTKVATPAKVTTQQNTAPKAQQESQNKTVTKAATASKVTTPENTASKVQQESQNKTVTKAATPAKVTTPQNTAPKVQQESQTKTVTKVATPAKVTTPQNTAPKVQQESQTKTVTKAATPAKVTTPQNSATKVTTPVNVTTKAQNPAPKVLPAKATQDNKNTAKTTPKQVTVTSSKPAIPNNQNKASKVATSKATYAVAAKTTGKPKVATNAKVSPKNKQSDFDELSDHDILALISKGIVLDECSGSDVE